MGQYLKLFNAHTNYQNFVNRGEMLRPNVSHCVQENEVHYNPRGVLPENQELWEKFNQIYGDNVTSEDLRLFSTYPMTYEVYNDLNNDNTYSHWIEINTDIKACYNYNTPNPDYRGLVDLNDQYGDNLYFQDSNDTATIDDFTGMGTTNHEWIGASCGK